MASTFTQALPLGCDTRSASIACASGARKTAAPSPPANLSAKGCLSANEQIERLVGVAPLYHSANLAWPRCTRYGRNRRSVTTVSSSPPSSTLSWRSVQCTGADGATCRPSMARRPRSTIAAAAGRSVASGRACSSCWPPWARYQRSSCLHVERNWERFVERGHADVGTCDALILADSDARPAT